MNSVDVLIPVYDGYEETVSCIQSALATLLDDARLVLVNDCSPSEQLSDYMRDLAAREERVVLLENEINLGFVGAVNRGLKNSDSSDVLLLNADVIVANDWLSRMRKRAYEKPNFGTVTAFSNNATICSFPNTCEPNEVPSRTTVAELDEHFSVLENEACIEIPTGVGSCMYIRRDCLDAVGLLDEETFGRGYGEENDFCMRAAKKGWLSVICPDVYVHHFGGVSFGEEKSNLEQQAVTKLNQLYPDYELQVHNYIQADPTKPMRLRVLAQMYARSERPTVLFVSHHLGGGVKRHLKELAGYLEGIVDVLSLNPIRENQVEVGFIVDGQRLNDALVYDVSTDIDHLVRFLKGCGVAHLHFHHIMGLPERIWGLIEALDCDYDVTVHDYYYINASPTQTDETGLYQTDEAKVDKMLPEGLTTEAWRDSQSAFLQNARFVLSPSLAAKNIYQEYFPNLDIHVCDHPDRAIYGSYSLPEELTMSEPLRIGVIGAISKEKGADVLERTALRAKKAGLPFSFFLIGYAYRPLDGLHAETGPYQEHELASLVASHNLDVIWFPATWPETYCYTLSSALELGLPVIATKLGAFTERLTGRPRSALVGLDEDVLEAFSVFKTRLQTEQDVSSIWKSSPNDDFYREQYVKDLKVVVPESTISLDQLSEASANVMQTWSERTGESVLRVLFRIRALPILSRIARLIPASFQKRVKRLLSRRPIHEL